MKLKFKPLNPRSPDTKYIGDEPTWRAQPTENRTTELSRAFNWYNYFYGKKEAKDFIASYLDTHDRKTDAKFVRNLGDSQVPLTTGWLCRMYVMGLQFTEHEQIKLDNMITEMLSIKKKPEVEPAAVATETQKPNIQDRLREKALECAGELEGLFDDFVTSGAKMSADWKPIATIRGMNVAPQMISIIVDIWKKKLVEFDAAHEGRDAQLVEAYSHFTKIQLRNIVKFAEQVVTDCANYVQIKKVERKPRAKKAVPPEKIAAKFKYLKAFAELKLTSESAIKLVGASEAWLYDTAKRKLVHVVADPHAGTFTIKGSSVVGFDTGATGQKTLRKPAETLKALMAAGKPAARKLFKEIRATETKFNGRGNENLIILRAW